MTCHAEIEVIRNFRTQYDEVDLSECILYTTHEPCIMCSYILRHHKVGMVVWGISTGEIGGVSSDYPTLSTTQISKWGVAPIIIKGVLEEECIQTLY
ncbi:nucleoside deaminase [Myroides odoratimimus]|nr:nucleoside deaminase [Myroides odoratimimus]